MYVEDFQPRSSQLCSQFLATLKQNIAKWQYLDSSSHLYQKCTPTTSHHTHTHKLSHLSEGKDNVLKTSFLSPSLEHTHTHTCTHTHVHTHTHTHAHTHTHKVKVQIVGVGERRKIRLVNARFSDLLILSADTSAMGG